LKSGTEKIKAWGFCPKKLNLTFGYAYFYLLEE
jgi:hypothetical protein